MPPPTPTGSRTSRSPCSCSSIPPTLSSTCTTPIAGPSSATGTMPASIPAHPRRRISRVCSSTAHRACARSPSCQLREQLAVLPTETRPTETEEKSMIPNFQTQTLDIQHGIALLNAPVRNKGTAFTPDERKRLGLEGLLPAPTDTLDRQVERVLGHLDGKPHDLERYIYLVALSDRKDPFFYRKVMSESRSFLPLLCSADNAEGR